MIRSVSEKPLVCAVNQEVTLELLKIIAYYIKHFPPIIYYVCLL